MTHDLRNALGIATNAALRAGVLLRQEFHRAGGPRGSNGHAEVDSEAERLIRTDLTSAYPDWGYVGEETSPPLRTAAELVWLVDPNDGTRSYLRGLRGSAVSIGLVQHGLPVLGVVYAPMAPDHAGDLFTWAQGLALTRNDREVPGRELPSVLGPLDVVLVSQDADRNPVANAACVSPSRFRGVPSIAYRLALAAAGEGDAAVSLNGPTSWDLAGGHALLRGAGGELVDERGQPIRYLGGHGGGNRVFGGSLELARELAGRGWASVMRKVSQDPLTVRYALPLLPAGTAVRDADLLARAQGCLLGQVAGDSLGELVEFRSAEWIAGRYPEGLRDLADGGTWNTIPGQPTDDSEMALILARALVRQNGFDDAVVGEAYRDWLGSHPFDVGGTIGLALRGRHNPESKSNGALMRAAPLGILTHRLPAESAAEIGRRDTMLTHRHPVCLDANAAYVIAVAHAIRTGDGRAAYDAALRWATGAGAHSEVVTAIRAAEGGPPAQFDGWDKGLVTLALQNAFHHLLHAESVEKGVCETVAQGGDTDTTGAIAGALLGAVYGREAVPVRWRRAVLSARALEDTPQPRPACFWPVDALEVAERLLVVGEL
jgi:ADP-ribosylglycohydrolase/fructose-1,6-bisphosphatase/inositol monophosphatase family enzyme